MTLNKFDIPVREHIIWPVCSSELVMYFRDIKWGSNFNWMGRTNTAGQDSRRCGNAYNIKHSVWDRIYHSESHFDPWKHSLLWANKIAMTMSLQKQNFRTVQHKLQTPKQNESPKWTERMRTETARRVGVSTVAQWHHHMTRHIMEMWERFDFLFMLWTANNKQLHSPSTTT